MVNGKQLTMTWQVDNLKASHVDPVQVTMFANRLQIIYAEIKTLPMYDYLGIILDYMETRKLMVDMEKYLDATKAYFLEEIFSKVPFPAAKNLFTVEGGQNKTTLT